MIKKFAVTLIFARVLSAVRLLLNRFRQTPATNPSERGTFQYDAKLGRVVKVADKPKEDGVYAMPLSDYLGRKNHLSKGSWHRQPDPAYASKESLKRDDFGRAGCRDGHGFHHPMYHNHCIHCGNTQKQIEKIWKGDGR